MRWIFAFIFFFGLISSAFSQSPFPSNLVTTVLVKTTKLDFLAASEVPEGVGSALVVSGEKGLLLAPAYLVQGAHWIDLFLPDGRQQGARLLAVDHLTGLAVLRTKPFGRVKARFRTKLPSPGERLLLLGRPRLVLAVREGVVTESPVRVPFRGISLASFFAASFSLAGMGSAPVFDQEGRVVGFALDLPNLSSPWQVKVVPAYLMKILLERVENEEHAVWAWLGVEGIRLTPTLARELKLPVSRGLLLTKVHSASPAARVGLRGARKLVSFGNLLVPVGGDVLLSFDGRGVRSQAQLERLLFTAKPGKLVEIKIWRKGKVRTVKIYLGKRSFVQP